MYRRWRVRHSYPAPVVDLVVRLIPLHGAATLARLLDIPPSVVYRWRAKNRDHAMVADATAGSAEALATLIARCDELGFCLPGHTRASGAPDRRSTDSVRRGEAVLASIASGVDAKAAALRPSQLPTCGDSLDERKKTLAAADPAEPLCTLEHASGAGQRYVFAACKERPGRGVRTRMEAVREAIDTRYFLDVDCRTLAESARMSLHHFMRVFRDMFGLSPHQYLARARVEAAKRLLLASSEPIEVIAVGVGFHSGPCLNRAFKRLEGMNASTYCRVAKKNRDSRKQWTSVSSAGAAISGQAFE
jgi:AraC-like DNA-binding protein